MSDANPRQPVYTGEFRHTMDAKHRLTIPSRWRRAAGVKDEFYLMPSPSNDYISALPPAEVDKMIHTFKAPIDQSNATAIVDYLSETKGAR
jgi:DNA-binding transcriptional regulator/RsmH inhibitor MraZ